MRIDTYGANRKLVAQAISEHIHEPVTYTGVPKCAYIIGEVTVERDGSVTTENADAWAALMPFFTASGWEEEARAQMQEHLEVVTETAEHAEEEQASETEADDEKETAQADSEAPGIECMAVRYSLFEFTVAGLTNFVKTLYTHQKLINAMLKEERLHIDEETLLLLKEMNTDNTVKAARVIHEEAALGINKGIDVADERIVIELPYDSEAPDAWKYGAKLLSTIADKAKDAHHMSGKLIDPEEGAMKYFCHSWLIALGFGGPDFKDLRAVLLNHLPGYAAFRTAEKMDAHKAKFIERRRAARAEQEANANEEN